MPNIGPMELVIVLVIALLILGPGKLPEVGSAFGKTIREFKKASTDFQESTSLTAAPAKEPAAAAAAAAAIPVEPAAPEAPLGTPAEPADDKA